MVQLQQQQINGVDEQGELLHHSQQQGEEQQQQLDEQPLRAPVATKWYDLRFSLAEDEAKYQAVSLCLPAPSRSTTAAAPRTSSPSFCSTPLPVARALSLRACTFDPGVY
jgi:hypothetical protein